MTNERGPMTPKLVTLETLQQHIPLPRSTVYALIRDKGAPAYKVGKRYLFDPEEWMAWVKEQGARTGRGSRSRLSARVLRIHAKVRRRAVFEAGKTEARRSSHLARGLNGEAGPVAAALSVEKVGES